MGQKRSLFHACIHSQVVLSQLFDRLLPIRYRVDGSEDFRTSFVGRYLRDLRLALARPQNHDMDLWMGDILEEAESMETEGRGLGYIEVPGRWTRNGVPQEVYVALEDFEFTYSEMED